LGFMSELNRWRRAEGLQPMLLGGLSFLRQREMSALYAFSRHLLPRPTDWGPNVHVTGHWFLNEDPQWQPPANLQAFLADGPAPVYVGFGSMVGRDPVKLAQVVFEALERAGRRGIVLSGWGGLGRGEVPDHVLMVDDVPHAWLFPRMGAVVHHGGAGTTAAGVRAGVPSIVAPYFADQPFWASRVQALGVGPRPIPQTELTAVGLAAAMSLALEDGGMRERAAKLGELIRAEDGVQVACEVFERFVAGQGQMRGK
jgi:sterol 3beta-glucosyltransferase